MGRLESQTAESRRQADPDTVDFAPMARQLKRLGARLGVDRPANDTLVLAAGCLAAVLLGVWLTSGAWGGGPPAGDDVTAYVIRSDFSIHHLIPRLRVDGWQPNFML